MATIRGWSNETAWVGTTTGSAFGGFFAKLAEGLENGIKHLMGQPCNDTFHERTARVTQIKEDARNTREAFYPEDHFCGIRRKRSK